jgi:bifunctional DNA primase/polymerase-like protein
VNAERSGNILAQLYTLLGERAVLLPLPFGEKKPLRPGWQSTTFEDTKAPDYQKELEAAIDRGGNIGVLLEGGRAAIDIDNDQFIAGMLALNPALAETLRSRGARGCQIWLRLVDDYPQRIHKLKKADGTVFGEWRGGGVHRALFLVSTLTAP